MRRSFTHSVIVGAAGCLFLLPLPRVATGGPESRARDGRVRSESRPGKSAARKSASDRQPKTLEQQGEICLTVRRELVEQGKLPANAPDAPPGEQQWRDQLAEVERQLADEAKRHEAAMTNLRGQESDARGNATRLRRVRKAIEKEIASHDRGKSQLERQRQMITAHLTPAAPPTDPAPPK